MAAQVTNNENNEATKIINPMIQNAFDVQQANTTDVKINKTDSTYGVDTFESPITSSDIRATGNDAVDYLNALRIAFPEYGVEQYINDKTIWQKQLYTIGGEQGFFYFKIFFNFRTNHGLLADLLADNEIGFSGSKSSAVYYLASNEHRYKQEQLTHRKLALYKFGAALHSMEVETPWIFKGVNQLDTLDMANFNNIGKTREIEILFNNETVDMRIGTLLDLYKYACYDTINMKEIIPANLRKFDMFILTFHVPIKNFQTEITTSKDGNKAIPAKTTMPNDNSLFSNVMSYKMYTFVNCEFDPASLNLYTPNQLNNETAFVMGNNVLKINADRVYEHRMNEWTQFMFGDDGFYYNRFSPSLYIGSGNLAGTGDVSGNAKATTDLTIGTDNSDLNNDRLKSLQAMGSIKDYTDRMIRDANEKKDEWKFYTGKNLTRTGKPNSLTRRNTSYLNRKLSRLHKGTLGKKIPFPRSIFEGATGSGYDFAAKLSNLF